MRTLTLGLLLGASLCVAVAAAAGCSGKAASATPTPQCTPPPAVALTVVVNGQNAQSFASKVVATRFVEGTGTVAFCTTSVVASVGTFGPIGGDTSGPFLSNPHLELVLNTESGSAWAYGTGDAHYAFVPGVDGTLSGTSCDAARTWTLPFDAGTAVQSAVIWPLGTRCP